MLQYVQNSIDRLKGFMAGIVAHKEMWKNSTTSEVTIQADIDELEIQNKKVEQVEIQLKDEKGKLKALVDAKELKSDMIEKEVASKHSAEPQKVEAYGIRLPGARKTRPIPQKGNIDSVDINTSNEGFVINLVRDANADYYEIQIAKTKADVLSIQPPFPIQLSSVKPSLSYDNIEKSVRLHIRTRAVNTTGAGEWSDIKVTVAL